MAEWRGMSGSLDTTAKLKSLLGDPDRAYPIIHIAGTNGKGSVALKVATALELAGHRVGLYTSPHLITVRERIQINRQPIFEEELENQLAQLFAVADQADLDPSYFEVVTVAAWHYFAQQQVDVVVCEVGLGGRLDSTNLVQPILSVITSIGLDHCDRLGATLCEIASEKGGIIKLGIPVVLGAMACGLGLEEQAQQMRSKLSVVDQKSADYRLQNCATARLALSQLASQFALTEAHIKAGLEAQQPCRYERVATPFPLILDVAHNAAGIAALLHLVAQDYPIYAIHVVAAFSQGKDVARCLSALQTVATLHLVGGEHSRLMSLADLLAFAQKQSLPLGSCGALAEILPSLLANPPEGVVVVCGSCFMMEETRQLLAEAAANSESAAD